MSKTKRLMAVAVALCILLPFGAAWGQSGWPVKPVRIIAPVQPSGGVDLIARVMAERLGKVYGQNFLVENISGGGGIVGSVTTAKAAPDGYTLMIGYVGTHGTNPALRKLPYDAVKDFTPIGMVGGTPNVLVVNPSVRASTLKEFVEYVRGDPKVSYGSAGQGTLTHLIGEQLKEASGLSMVHVPYKGIGPALADLLGGQTNASFPGLAAALPHIRAGKLRPLAVTGGARHALLPNIATFEEAGLKGFDGVQWYGIVGPAGMAQPLVRRLNEEINRLLGAADLKEKLSAEALEPMPMSPEQFGEYIRSDIAKWERVVKARKIEIE